MTWIDGIDRRIEAWMEARVGRDARDMALADALRVVAAAMRAGATLQQALVRASQRESGCVSAACASAASRMSLGCDVADEVDAFAVRLDTPAARLFAQVVRVQHRRGGDLSGPCHRLAALLHDRARLDAEARSATAQARFSARAVLAIPLLLALAAAWRAPDATQALLQPGSLALALPGLVLIATGAVLARRIAHTAHHQTSSHAPRRSTARPWLGRVAGSGSRTRQGIRLASVGLFLCVPVLLATRLSLTAVVGTVVVVGAAVMWPWSERARRRRMQRAVAGSGIESLLEVSVALFAAGATAHEVATLAPASTPEPLRTVLAPAVHRVGLGRSIAQAFDDVPEVSALPQLDGWLHAICTSSELGAPCVDVLEQLLRDARATRREQLRSIAQTAAPRMQLALVLLVVPGVMWLMLLATVGNLVGQLHGSGVL